MKKCAFFKCVNRNTCDDVNCPGCGGTGYQNCGCSVCVSQSLVGDMEICEVALCLREADMEEGE